MKKVFHRYPYPAKVLLATALGAAIIMASGFVYNAVPLKPWFPFVGEALLIGATVLLYRTEKDALPPVGLSPTCRHLGYLLLGLVIGLAALWVVTWLRTFYTGEGWYLSSAVDATALLKSLYFILPSVMMQELLFRGYLFTKTVSRFGVAVANVAFAILFMLVHVLDRDVLLHPAQVVSLAVCIPVGHLWFATALLRSRTLFFPIGLHWGNNWAVQHLFGTADDRQHLFYLTHQKEVASWTSFAVLLLIFTVFFLLVTWATWKVRWPVLPKATA